MPITPMTVNPITTSAYALKIYRLGTARLAEREGWTGLVIPAEYYEPVERYAASHYNTEQIENAFNQNWINSQECDETITYKIPQ